MRCATPDFFLKFIKIEKTVSNSSEFHGIPGREFQEFLTSKVQTVGKRLFKVFLVFSWKKTISNPGSLSDKTPNPAVPLNMKLFTLSIIK